jgi:hypothetical protein
MNPVENSTRGTEEEGVGEGEERGVTRYDTTKYLLSSPPLLYNAR